MLTTYVHAKFRSASKALKLLQTEWHSAETKHSSFVDLAQQSLSKLRIPAPAAAHVSRGSGIGFDLRNQILSMAKRGSTAQDIARTCGLQEGEVDVILGMARLQR